MALVHLYHAAHVVKLGCAAEVVELVQSKGAVLRHELHVVVEPGVSDGLDHGWPGAVNVSA